MHLAARESRGGAPARVGFVVSKAVGNAVVRNRTKRRLRALMAERIEDLPAGVDVVVRAQPAAAAATYDELGRDIDRCLRRIVSAPSSRALADRGRTVLDADPGTSGTAGKVSP